MSLSSDGVWKSGVWDTSVWANDVWKESSGCEGQVWADGVWADGVFGDELFCNNALAPAPPPAEEPSPSPSGGGSSRYGRYSTNWHRNEKSHLDREKEKREHTARLMREDQEILDVIIAFVTKGQTE